MNILTEISINNLMKVSINFDFIQPYTLENDRVILRPLALNDFSLLEKYVITEPDLWEYALVSIKEGKDLEKYIYDAVQSRIQKTAYPFIVFDKLSQSYVGVTRFYDMQFSNKTSLLGYTWYSKKVWGTGLNQHCKFLLLQFALDELGFERIEFRADSNNKRSIAAMQKIGCTIEGVLRNHLPLPNGTRRDTIVLSILKEEWAAKLKQNLQAQLK